MLFKLNKSHSLIFIRLCVWLLFMTGNKASGSCGQGHTTFWWGVKLKAVSRACPVATEICLVTGIAKLARNHGFAKDLEAG